MLLLCASFVACASCALLGHEPADESCPDASRFHSAFEEGGQLDAAVLLAAAAERPWEYAYAFDDIFDLVTSDSPDPALLCVASILSHVNQHRNESEFVWPARRPWPERFHGTWFSLLAQLEVCRVRYMRWFEEDPKMLVAALRGNWRMDDPLIEGLAADVAMEIVDRYGLWHQRDVQDAMAVAASRDPDLSHIDPQAEAAMWRSAMRRIDRLTQGSSIRR